MFNVHKKNLTKITLIADLTMIFTQQFARFYIWKTFEEEIYIQAKALEIASLVGLPEEQVAALE